MGILLLTALAIQNSSVEVHTFSADEKYGYEIARFERENYRPLITCKPIYKTEPEAKEEGIKLVQEIRGIDLSEKVKGIKKILGEEQLEAVEDIVTAAR